MLFDVVELDVMERDAVTAVLPKPLESDCNDCVTLCFTFTAIVLKAFDSRFLACVVQCVVFSAIVFKAFVSDCVAQCDMARAFVWL